MAAAIPVAAGVGARLIAGGYAYPGETGSDGGRLVGLAVLVAGAALAWSLFRPLSVFCRHGDRNPSANAAGEERGRRRVPSLLIAALSVVLAAGLALAAGTSGKWTEPSSGADHGRVAEWKAAAETALDRPLAGAGAGGYATASAEHQSQPAGLYAHDLPLETWAELGPLGLALVVALYASAGALCWRIRNRPGAWLVVPGALAFLVANLVDWPWHLAGSAAVWALCVGACLALERRVPAA
jgi:O-antigen ligase